MLKKLIFFLLITTQTAFSQQNLSLQQCEDKFVKNNLLLLAEQYNLDIAKASVIQAKIWDLPVVSGEINAINPPDKRVLYIGAKGQKAIAVQQLLYLGKKKQNEVEFAKSTIGIAELQFEQLLKNLRFELHQSFYSIYFNQQKITNINKQIASVDTLVKSYAVQAQRGNWPLRDVVRLQSLSFELKNDVMIAQKEINDEQESLKILTSSQENIIPIVEEQALNSYFTKNNLPVTEALLNMALEKNPDYLSFQKIIESNELMIKWQKSLTKPDLTVGASYDQRGGAFGNQVNFTFGIPLNLWNRNKGNIKIAEAELDKSKRLQDQKIVELRSQIANATQTWQQQRLQYAQITASGSENLEAVYKGILQNFQKQNISLLEFTDFMESYNQSTLLLIEMRKQVILSGETINHIVNVNLF
ncbi:TolC family protein [Emticicia oligotrophica]|uniref:TolC family protein n=1 Tax=Emticicia oligotrophica TaxID=312279 RepID=UPI00273C056E|nr:TolC family protein [Emticicia oligotrophica]